MKLFTKDPNAKLDYTVDGARWLGTDTIQTSTWTVPTGLTNESTSNSGTTATIWLSGGAVGQRYKVTNHIVTVAGRQDDRSFEVTIAQR